MEPQVVQNAIICSITIDPERIQSDYVEMWAWKHKGKIIDLVTQENLSQVIEEIKTEILSDIELYLRRSKEHLEEETPEFGHITANITVSLEGLDLDNIIREAISKQIDKETEELLEYDEQGASEDLS